MPECNRDPWHRIPFLLRIRRPINTRPCWTLVWNLRDLNMGGKGTPITVYRHDYFFRFKPLSLWKWDVLTVLFLLHCFAGSEYDKHSANVGITYFGFRDKNLGHTSVLNYIWKHIHTQAYIHTHICTCILASAACENLKKTKATVFSCWSCNIFTAIDT